jgi:site-specific DNA-methyltransferase (adenine-specific)
MEYLKTLPDKAFELAIVDPPYGLGDRLVNGGHKKNPMEKYRKSYEQKRWDIAPDKEYFSELFRVSVNQIIWGGNYFNLPPTRGIIAWDKKQMMPTFSRWEFAWTSFDCPARMYEGIAQEKDELRFHPTQKPVQLYIWLLKNYAKPGDRILDTHLGSGSSRIAAYEMGFDFVGCEIDKDYFEAQEKRWEHHISQLRIDV